MAKDSHSTHLDQDQGQEEDYYSVLNLTSRKHDRTLSPAEIKQAYKKALLVHHPDKRTPTSAQPVSSNCTCNFSHSSSPNSRTVSIDTLLLASKILSTPSLRQEYDKSLATTNSANGRGLQVFHTGLETADLDDLGFDEGSGVWTRSCRCGDEGGFVVTERELESSAQDGEGEVVVGCRGCSLWLRVLFGVEEG